MLTKRCIRCLEEKLLDPTNFYKHPRMKDGFSCYCIGCQKVINTEAYRKNKQQRFGQMRWWRSHNQSKVRANAMRCYLRARVKGTEQTRKRKAQLQKYGLDESSFNARLEAQGGVCAICKGPPVGRWNRFHVDHDHGTEAVRGLLCSKCNCALGYFDDDLERLKVAVAYLEAAGKVC